jgi:hypothetical protein
VAEHFPSPPAGTTLLSNMTGKEEDSMLENALLLDGKQSNS